MLPTSIFLTMNYHRAYASKKSGSMRWLVGLYSVLAVHPYDIDLGTIQPITQNYFFP